MIRAQLGQAGIARGQRKQADQPVYANILASLYLSTVGRFGIAFHNPESSLLLFLSNQRMARFCEIQGFL